MKRRQRPELVDPARPKQLARFEVTDWCDPTAEPPEWWRWQNAHAADHHREVETVEWYWYCHARLEHMRGLRAWEDARNVR